MNSLVKDKRTILLQTAQAIAVNPVTNCEQPVRILLDKGSQRSYITNELQHKLKLVPDHYERLQLNTFGDNITDQRVVTLFNSISVNHILLTTLMSLRFVSL